MQLGAERIRRIVAVAIACLVLGGVAGLVAVEPETPRAMRAIPRKLTSTTATSTTLFLPTTSTIGASPPTTTRTKATTGVTRPKAATTTVAAHTPPSAAGSIVFISRKSQPPPTPGPVTPGSGGYNLWLMAANGSGQRQLTFTSHDAQPALSPDGRWVAWVVGDREVWVMGSDASQPRKLHACPFGCMSPRWSPDGHTLAFVSLDDTAANNGSVVRMAADGANLHQYSTPQFDAYSIDWSPDGTKFAVNTYGASGGLWIMNVGDGSAQKIRTGNSGSPSWAPDGGRILFSDGAKLQTVKPTGEGLREFSKGTSGQYLAGHWSPDGHSVVFDFCCRDGKLEQVGLMNADGTGERFLTDGAFEAYESTF